MSTSNDYPRYRLVAYPYNYDGGSGVIPPSLSLKRPSIYVGCTFAIGIDGELSYKAGATYDLPIFQNGAPCTTPTLLLPFLQNGIQAIDFTELHIVGIIETYIGYFPFDSESGVYYKVSFNLWFLELI